MARQKIVVPLLGNWKEVDDTLRRIGEINRELDLLNNVMIEEIESAKEKAAGSMGELMIEHKQLASAVEQFANHHLESFQKQRSRKLNFGTIGFHKTPGKFKTLSKWKWDDVLAKLKQLRKKKYIRVKETVDKESLEKDYKTQKITDQALEIFGLHWYVEDEFYFEVNEEKIEETV